MFVDASGASSKDNGKGGKNKFITIREKPEMTLIRTGIERRDERDWLRVTFPRVIRTATSAGGEGEGGGTPAVDYEEGVKSILVPLEADREWLEGNAQLIDAEIWEYETDAWAFMEGEIAETVKEYFTAWDEEKGAHVRLVIKGPTERICRGNGAEEYLGRKEYVNFPDVLPVQVASEASLRELNGRLKEKGAEEITIERFRPNVIVDGEGLEPWEEDEWKLLRINPPTSVMGSLATMTGVGNKSIDIDVSARCARCHVPNVDPETAVPDKKEPWGTLYGYRRVDEGIKFKPCFGMLCCPRNEGPIEVGMDVEIMEVMSSAGGKGEHHYVKGF